MAFPRKRVEINALLQLWKDRFLTHQARYGLTSEQIRQVSDDADVYNHLLTVRNQLDEDVGEFSAYFENVTDGDVNLPAADYPVITLLPLPGLLLGVKPGIIPRNKGLYNFFKNHPSRTDESLADLGISDPAPGSLTPDTLKPAISGSTMPDDRVSLVFNKQGQSAVRFQMRRAAVWTTVADPTTSPFIDATPSTGGNPEKREYRAIYLEKNQPIGQYSDIITVYTTP